MKLLILGSGSDQRFEEKGYQYPKNLIEMNGKPLIQHVLESLEPVISAGDQVIVTLRKKESELYHTSIVAKLLVPECKIVEVQGETKGATCTALLAAQEIDCGEAFLIVNGDIILDAPVKDAVRYFQDRGADGGVITFESVHPRWSYVKCDADGFVIEATEKKPISKIATVGVYYYRKGSDFVEAAKNSIRKDARIDGKFYICPVYNEMVLKQKRILTYPIDAGDYHSIATPEGVENYKKYLKEKKG